MRIHLISILLFICQFSFAQSRKDSIIPIVTYLRIDRVKERQEKIDAFAAKIDKYEKGELPDFLFNECFDFQGGVSMGFHMRRSIRWEVLKRVNNKHALGLILKSRDKRLEKKCIEGSSSMYDASIPMIDQSFRQLMHKRYKEL